MSREGYKLSLETCFKIQKIKIKSYAPKNKNVHFRQKVGFVRVPRRIVITRNFLNDLYSFFIQSPNQKVYSNCNQTTNNNSKFVLFKMQTKMFIQTNTKQTNNNTVTIQLFSFCYFSVISMIAS